MSEAVSDLADVEAANAAFYAAFETADMDALADLWDDRDVSCVHPGWPALHGRSRVLRSWALILANTEYLSIVVTDVSTVTYGDVAVVTCTENLLASLTEAAGSGTVVATNVFRRRDGRWRLAVHHGSPMLAPLDATADEDDA